jgi:hypothetical protein
VRGMNCRTFRKNLRKGIGNAQMDAHAADCTECRARLLAVAAVRSDRPVPLTLPDGHKDLERRVVSAVMGHSTETEPVQSDASRWHAPGKTPPGGLMPRFALAAAAVFLVVATATVTTLINRAASGPPVVVGTTESVAGSVEATADAHTPASAADTRNAPDTSGASNTVEVYLVLEAPQARSVSVAGGWNGWDPAAHRLSDENGDGIWELRFTVEADREYEYQFVIDENTWIEDPQSPFHVDDGFGGVNSILDV